MRDLCPCKDCERKGCGEYHSQCEAYKNFKIALEQEKADLKKHRAKYQYEIHRKMH